MSVKTREISHAIAKEARAVKKNGKKCDILTAAITFPAPLGYLKDAEL